MTTKEETKTTTALVPVTPKAKAEPTTRKARVTVAAISSEKAQKMVGIQADIRNAVDGSIQHAARSLSYQQEAAYHITRLAEIDSNVAGWLRNPDTKNFSMSTLLERVFGAHPDSDDLEIKSKQRALDGTRRQVLVRAVGIARIVRSKLGHGSRWDAEKRRWNVPAKLLLGKNEVFNAKQNTLIPLSNAQVVVKSTAKNKDGIVSGKPRTIQASPTQLLAATASKEREAHHNGSSKVIKLTAAHLEHLALMLASDNPPFKAGGDMHKALVNVVAALPYHYKAEMVRAIKEHDVMEQKQKDKTEERKSAANS